MYWLTATAHSSARMYYETTKSGNFGTRGEHVETPTGCARFPGEIIRPPRSWVEQSYNVVHWTAHAARRAFRRDGTARAARHRRPRVLPGHPLMDQFAGRVAVVTGAGSGIGQGLARHAASEGMHVVVADVEHGALEATATELRDGGTEVLSVPTDVSDAG